MLMLLTRALHAKDSEKLLDVMLQQSQFRRTQNPYAPNSAEAAAPLLHVGLRVWVCRVCRWTQDFTYIFNSIGSWAYVAYSTWNIGPALGSLDVQESGCPEANP